MTVFIFSRKQSDIMSQPHRDLLSIQRLRLWNAISANVKCPQNCGIRPEVGIECFLNNFFNIFFSNSFAIHFSAYGAYPWEVIILTSNSPAAEFISGGVLINNRYVLTTAHKIYYS
jgi:hypothetical protein